MCLKRLSGNSCTIQFMSCSEQFTAEISKLPWIDLLNSKFVFIYLTSHFLEFMSAIFCLRLSNSVRQSGKYPGCTSGTLWPPFRLPFATHPSYEDPSKILLSRSFHAILFMLLYKAVRSPMEMSEQSLALVIYLLDLAISLSLQQSTSLGNVRIC